MLTCVYSLPNKGQTRTFARVGVATGLQEKCVWFVRAGSSMEPVPRYRHAAAGAGQKLYVWGGSGHTAKVETTTIESFDVPSETWQQPQRLHGSLPDGLRGMTVTSDGESAYSFGGSTEKDSSKNLEYYNTLYQINLSTLQSKELVPGASSNAPQKKSNSTIVYFDQKLVVHGGRSSGGDLTNELHVFDLKSSE